MGFTTAVIISNDRFEELRQRPSDLVHDIAVGMSSPLADNLLGSGRRMGAATVVPAEHQSTPQLLSVHQGRVIPLHLGEFLLRPNAMGSDPHTCAAIQNAVDEARKQLDRVQAALDAQAVTP